MIIYIAIVREHLACNNIRILPNREEWSGHFEVTEKLRKMLLDLYQG
jgi:hypothetical protein